MSSEAQSRCIRDSFLWPQAKHSGASEGARGDGYGVLLGADGVPLRGAAVPGEALLERDPRGAG